MSTPLVAGAAHVERSRGGRPFVRRLVDDGTLDTLAWLGRGGWFRIFFGPGQRIRTGEGADWRLRGVSSGPAICPAVVTGAGKLAIAHPGPGNYLLNGPDYAYALNPTGRRGLTRPDRWTLRAWEDDVATVGDGGDRIQVAEPVPLPAVLLSMLLARYAIPGEAELRVPTFTWA